MADPDTAGRVGPALGECRTAAAAAPPGLELFLAHPEGLRQRRDEACGPFPAVEAGETLLAAACREFQEETGIVPAGPFLALGSIRQKAGKLIHAWGWEGDADPADQSIHGNRMAARVGSPDLVSRGGSLRLVQPAEARIRLNPAQAELVDRLGVHPGGVIGSEGGLPRNQRRRHDVAVRKE